MELYQDAIIKIFFGDKNTAVYPDVVRGKISEQLYDQEPFRSIGKKFLIHPSTYVFLHQVHGVEGAVITQENGKFPAFTQEGDYLVTNVPGIGIGVATADCMPLVLVDPVKKAVGVVHAGWRGLVAGVVEKTVERMQFEYGSRLGDINFLIGPSAQKCCYEVGKDFFDQACAVRPSIEKFLNGALSEINDRFFFDNKKFLLALFFEKGFVESDFNFLHAECTICKPLYCSYRRDKMSPLRQLTIVSLK